MRRGVQCIKGARHDRRARRFRHRLFEPGYLQRLPIDTPQDRPQLRFRHDDRPDSVAIVRAVLSLAEALGMSTTAEGIETVELATTLAALGCASGRAIILPSRRADAALDYWRSRRR